MLGSFSVKTLYPGFAIFKPKKGGGGLGLGEFDNDTETEALIDGVEETEIDGVKDELREIDDEGEILEDGLKERETDGLKDGDILTLGELLMLDEGDCDGVAEIDADSLETSYTMVKSGALPLSQV